MDQLPAQVFVAALADPEQLRLAAGRELAGNQAEPRGEIAPALEALSLADGRDKGGCDDRADAWDCHQPASLFVLLHPADELGIEGCDPSIDLAHCVRASATSPIIRGLNPEQFLAVLMDEQNGVRFWSKKAGKRASLGRPEFSLGR